MSDKTKKTFPARVFLRWEGDPPYLIGHPDLSNASDAEDQTLGVYVLQSEVETRMVTQYRPKGAKSWVDEGK